MHIKRSLLGLALLPCVALAFDESQIVSHPVGQMIDRGQWREARQQIETSLSHSNLDFYSQWQLLFQKERMRRIRRDYPNTQEQVWTELKEHIPNFDRSKFEKWEKEGWVESIPIDGQRWYFKKASINAARLAMHRSKPPATGTIPSNTLHQVRAAIENHRQTGEKYGTPQTWRITFSLTVKADAVPEGETVRAWLPMPQETDRQRKVRIVSTVPAHYSVPPAGHPLMSLYLEKTATAGKPVEFKAVYEYEALGYYQTLDPKRVKALGTNLTDLAPWLAERPPHIMLNKDIKKLAKDIVGEETNPLLKVQRLFAWVHPNVCWTYTREYSTFTSISDYVYEHRWGDCGLQTLFFMALCRSQEIPARWESGWTLGKYGGQHDWCTIYLEPYGWIPVDVTIGPLKSEDEAVKLFYLGGMDNGRLVVNLDYGQTTFPAKSFCRSEPIDFQNGEAEWRGGNIFFDQLEYKLKSEPVPDPKSETLP